MSLAIILASGSGSRIKQSNIPKQFIEINNKPIVIHTIERFIYNKDVDCVIVACHPEWIDYLTKYIKNFFPNKKIHIVNGGNERNDSIANAIKFIESNKIANEQDVILTHDAVRMFVSDRIINENIEMCKKFDAVDTVVKTVDTIVNSQDGVNINSIPERDSLYNGQTPQTFKYYLLKDLYLKKDIDNTSDACKLLISKNKLKIKLVFGEYENFKITTDFDLDYAKKMVNKND